MSNFWDFSSWGFFNLTAVLLASLLAANMLKRSIPVLEASLIPTSVLGGGILLVISATYKAFTGTEMFNTEAQTNVVSFTAITGTEDGSVVLSFTVDGPEKSPDWTVYYTTEGEEEKSVTFSGRMVTLNGLTIGKEYNA